MKSCKSIVFAFACIVPICLSAQQTHSLGIHIGKSKYSDWKGMHQFEFGIDYEYITRQNIIIHPLFNYYSGGILNIMPFAPNSDLIIGDEASEVGLGAGYQLRPMMHSCILVKPHIDFLYHTLNEDFVLVAGFHSGGWYEIIFGGKQYKSFGTALALDVEYPLSKRFSLSLYGSQKIFFTGPNSFSIGAKVNVLFYMQ
ncbi:MAG: hypothetical protein H0W62_11725 [Chitinophagales bacterium]|nr:hypothetical protein [Chitinophagales bacterium]